MALDNNACPTNSEIMYSRTYGGASQFPVNFTPRKINLLYKSGDADNSIPIDYVDYDWILFVFVTTQRLSRLTFDSQYNNPTTISISNSNQIATEPTVHLICNRDGNLLFTKLT